MTNLLKTLSGKAIGDDFVTQGRSGLVSDSEEPVKIESYHETT